MTTLTQDRARRRTALIAGSVAALMIGAAYASVPLYRIFCAATGFDGTPIRDTAIPGAAEVQALGGRTVKVRFDGNVAPGMAWRFGPKSAAITVKIGPEEHGCLHGHQSQRQTLNRPRRLQRHPRHRRAVLPQDRLLLLRQSDAGKPGETVDMPVTFFVDPSIVRDKQASRIDEITLSYTFFPVDNPGAQTVSRTAANDKG